MKSSSLAGKKMILPLLRQYVSTVLNKKILDANFFLKKPMRPHAIYQSEKYF